MKKVILSILLFWTFISSANTINSFGFGKTEDEAIQNALKNAVKMHRSVFVSELEIQDGKLKKDQTLNFTSAYIKNYKLLDIKKIDGKFYAELQVSLEDNPIADRILYSSKNKDMLNGKEIAEKTSNYIDTQKNFRDKSTKLLISVMDSYPSTALEVKFDGTEIVYDGEQNTIFNVYYKLKWNNNFINSLNETIKIIKENYSPNNCNNCNNYINKATNKINFFKTKNQFLDRDFYNIIIEKLNKPVYLNVKFLNNSEVVYNECIEQTFNFENNSNLILGANNPSIYVLDYKFDNKFKSLLSNTNSIKLNLTNNCID